MPWPPSRPLNPLEQRPDDESPADDASPFWAQWSDEERLTQVHAARLRIQTDKRLGRTTPDAVKEVARLPPSPLPPADEK